ncbi:MAG: hypothetical protein KDE19_10535 [Caldilineaceae bacterium]|nr:hypothetical protein [Caldilineaceae bacterium]
MLRQTVDFDWQIGDELTWTWGEPSPTNEPSGSSVSESQVALALLRSVILFVAALCTVGSLPIPDDQLARLQAQQAVRFALTQEQRLQARGERQQYHALVDTTVTSRWQNNWRTAFENGLEQEDGAPLTLLAVDAQQEMAVATVLIEDPAPEWGNPRLYREKRYYRSRGQSWLRTLPTANFWGEVKTIETVHFRLEYYEPDGAAVEATSKRLDTIYATLYHRLALVPPIQREKQIIAIVPDLINNWRSYENRVEITTPTLAPVPALLTDEEYLTQIIANRMIYFGVQEAMARTRTGTEYRWNLMLWGVRSWLLQELVGQQSPWAVEAEAALRTFLRTQPHIDLEMVNRWYSVDQPNATEIMARYILAEAIVTYALATYGTDRLPILLQDFSVYSRWKDLIPRAFGVPLEEFEAGWRAYVQERYGPVDSEQ